MNIISIVQSIASKNSQIVRMCPLFTVLFFLFWQTPPSLEGPDLIQLDGAGFALFWPIFLIKPLIKLLGPKFFELVGLVPPGKFRVVKG